MAEYLKDGEQQYSMEAEAAVLGSMIIDKKCIPEVLAIISRTEMFYLPEHQSIFDALVNLHIKNKPTDAVLLRSELKNSNQLKSIGGVEYIKKILDSVPSSANALYYCRIVRDKSAYRKMVQIVWEIKKVSTEPGQINEQIEKIQHLALTLRVEKEDEAHEFKTDVMESMMAMGDKRDCLPTGFYNIDRIIQGLFPTEMIVLAGRPGMGKSSLALDILLNMTETDRKAIIFSLEMSYEAIMQRAVCSLASVDPQKWEGTPPEEEFDKILHTANELTKRNIVIYDTINTVEKMQAIISVRAKTVGVDIVVIDNIQIMSTAKHKDKEYDRLTEITRLLKRLVMCAKIPIIVISHLNRDIEKRANHMPRLSDLRGSGSLEQDADKVIFLHREDQYRKIEKPDIDPSEFDGVAYIIIAKNRRGKTGIAKLLFREDYTTFRNLAPEYLEEGKG